MIRDCSVAKTQMCITGGICVVPNPFNMSTMSEKQRGSVHCQKENFAVTQPTHAQKV